MDYQKNKNKIRISHGAYRYQYRHLRRHPLHLRLFFYVLSAIILVLTVTLISSHFHQVFPKDLFTVFKRISPRTLLLYGLYTLIRLIISFIFSLLFTILVVLLITDHKRIENYLLPVFDILQSVPVLAFFPLIIVAFANLHLPELSAQIVLFVAMTWPVLFGAIGGLHQIPQDILDAAEVYGARGFKKFTKVILPAIFPPIVTGSILSFGAGWNVIIISEYINYGNIHIELPGLGSLLSSNAGKDTGVFLVSLLLLVLIITLMNRLFWHRLIDYTEKFRFE